MTAGVETFDRTVAALYRAAAGQERFDRALTLLVESLGEKLIGAQMIGVNPATGGLTFSHTNLGAPGEAELEYMHIGRRITHLGEGWAVRAGDGLSVPLQAAPSPRGRLPRAAP